MSEVTKDDLRDMRDTIVEEMRLGFEGVHKRQDTANGRLTKAEVADERHDVRLKNLEREIFHRAHRRGRQGAGTEGAEAAQEDRPALTRRELKLIVGFAAAAWAMFQGMAALGPLLRSLLFGGAP